MEYELVVDRIYESAIFPDKWMGALDGLVAATDNAQATLLTRRADAWVGWRLSEQYVDTAEAWLNSDGPSRSIAPVRLFQAAHAGFLADHQLFTTEEYLNDPLIAEWARPNGLHHGAATAIHAPSGDLAVLQVMRRRGEPPFGAQDIAKLDSFRPHLARAAMLSARWRMEQLRAASAALELLGLAAAVLDTRGRTLATNKLMEKANNHVHWLRADRFAFFDRAAEQLLEGLLTAPARAVETARSFVVRGEKQAAAIIAHLIPISGQARDLFGGGLTLLVLTAAQMGRAADAALLRGLFDLTAAEARVAAGILDGLTLTKIAKLHGVSIETVRSQAKAVLGKTGSRRQSEFIVNFRPIQLPIDRGS